MIEPTDIFVTVSVGLVGHDTNTLGFLPGLLVLKHQWGSNPWGWILDHGFNDIPFWVDSPILCPTCCLRRGSHLCLLQRHLRARHRPLGKGNHHASDGWHEGAAPRFVVISSRFRGLASFSAKDMGNQLHRTLRHSFLFCFFFFFFSKLSILKEN